MTSVLGGTHITQLVHHIQHYINKYFYTTTANVLSNFSTKLGGGREYITLTPIVFVMKGHSILTPPT